MKTSPLAFLTKKMLLICEWPNLKTKFLANHEEIKRKSIFWRCLELRSPSGCGGPFGAGRWINGWIVFAEAVRQRSKLKVGHQIWREDRLQVLGESEMIGFGNVNTSGLQIKPLVVPVRIDRRKCVRMLVVSTKQQGGQCGNACTQKERFN